MAEIREVTRKAEMDVVAALARAIWTEHYAAITGLAQVEYMLGRFQSAPAISEQIGGGYRYFLVAEDDADVGYMALVPDGPGGKVMLSKLYVRADMRGRGLGRMMVEHAERFCREEGAGLLWLTVNKHNSDSIAAYEHMGFVRTGEPVTDIGGGFVMDDYRLEKRVV